MGNSALPNVGTASASLRSPVAVTRSALDDSTYDHALAELAVGHVGAAFEALGNLADAEDARAARIALMLQCRGNGLYGVHLAAAPARRAHWLEVASHEA